VGLGLFDGSLRNVKTHGASGETIATFAPLLQRSLSSLGRQQNEGAAVKQLFVELRPTAHRAGGAPQAIHPGLTRKLFVAILAEKNADVLRHGRFLLDPSSLHTE
jgi:hypothetical protein